MKKALVLLALVAALGLVICAGPVVAADPPDEISIYNEAVFGKMKKGPVAFHHAKHSGEYGAKCTDCHHSGDYDGTTNNWNEGDAVLKCSECHKKDKVGKVDKLQNAFHKNCKGCHKDLGKGPEKKCNECHAEK